MKQPRKPLSFDLDLSSKTTEAAPPVPPATARPEEAPTERQQLGVRIAKDIYKRLRRKALEDEVLVQHGLGSPLVSTSAVAAILGGHPSLSRRPASPRSACSPGPASVAALPGLPPGALRRLPWRAERRARRRWRPRVRQRAGRCSLCVL